MENYFHLIERNSFMFTLQLRDFIGTFIEDSVERTQIEFSG